MEECGSVTLEENGLVPHVPDEERHVG
jgi:hypothetical protein